MSDGRAERERIKVRVSGNRSVEALQAFQADYDRLLELTEHATEFTFRPDYGDVNDQFSDDPEHYDAVVVSWRGAPMGVGDPDRWAITFHQRWCWSRSQARFVFEPRPSDREEDFFADHRFSRDEAVAMVPEILRGIEAEKLPRLRELAATFGPREVAVVPETSRP